jgi:2-oxoisovalerate dehydrogenase E1 component
MRERHNAAISNLPEIQQLNVLRTALIKETIRPSGHVRSLSEARSAHPNVFSSKNLSIVLDAALMTSLLHIESRAASIMGEGFYTIGPGGEELMGALGVTAHVTDPMALHYRHLATQIARRLKEGQAAKDILLTRARGFCVSSLDPVTGGAHCALGGGPNDFLVTSTLASQTCPAVGRALGGSLAHHLKVPSPFAKDFVSIVSLGDGSVNNGHYLSGENLANFATFRNHRVPLLTCVTDNGISISFRTHGYLQKSFSKRWQCKVVPARGDDMVDLMLRTHEAMSYVRSNRKPAVLLVTDLTRRFGHAATDRQAAYMPPEEIKRRHSTCMLTSLCGSLVEAKMYTPAELLHRLDELHAWTMDAFDVAHAEPKLSSREALVERVAAPLLPMPTAYSQPSLVELTIRKPIAHVVSASFGVTGASAHVMRKHMNKVFDDAMRSQQDMVYIGEDVQHGGYYMITDGLDKKHPGRVQDFPPDETSLVGVGMGYRHSGLLPIVEIPYAKYLDCAMDMFTEACMMNFLSNGKQPNGMIFRLQGFGRGVFGGNYHTHNMLHMPPGLDVVCYSNGRDYARGMRYAMQQARNGRVSMFVDCTELLNLREVQHGISWEMPYTADTEFCTYDDVFLYRGKTLSLEDDAKRALIVTFGNGVPLALQAQEQLVQEKVEVDVCDCPLLSSVPQGLDNLLATGAYDRVLFADVCKEGQNPLSSHMAILMNRGRLGNAAVRARCTAAPRTYNPLGNTLTFLNIHDVVQGVNGL